MILGSVNEIFRDEMPQNKPPLLYYFYHNCYIQLVGHISLYSMYEYREIREI